MGDATGLEVRGAGPRTSIMIIRRVALLAAAALTATLPRPAQPDAQTPDDSAQPPLKAPPADIAEVVPSAAPLASGASVERELAGGERHLYRVTLREQQVLRAVATQHGIDLVLSIAAPGGQTLLEVDTPNGPEGPEILAFLATAAGEYFLELRAPGDQVAGSYELRVTIPDPAEASDRALASALAAFAGGERLRSRGNARAAHLALEAYRAALVDGRRAEEPRLQALTRRRLGQIHYRLGEIREAVEQLEAARELYERHGSAREKLPLLNDLGAAYRLAGEAPAALACHQEALELAERVNSRAGIATALNNIGLAYNSLGELHQALDFYHRAMAEWQRLGFLDRYSTALHNVGQIYATLGRTEEAADFLDQALELRRRLDDPRRLVSTLTAVGWVSQLEGEPAGALEYFAEALRLARQAADRIGEAVTLDLRAAAYRDLGRTTEARDSYLTALDIFRASGSLLDQAHTLSHLGELYDVTGDAPAAAESHRQAVELFRKIGDVNGQASALAAAARAARRRGDLRAARGQLEAALELAESVRGRLQSRTLRRDYAARRYGIHAEYVDLLMELEATEPGRGHTQRALEASERSRARSLLESLAEAEAGVRERAPEELLAAERVARAAIARAERRRRDLVAEGAEQTDVEAAEREIRGLLLDYERSQDSLRTHTRRWSNLTGAPPITVRDLQTSLLDADTLLLWYALGSERSFLWVVGRDVFEAFALPAEQQIDPLARRVAELIPRSHERGLRMQASLAAADLSDMILAPAASLLGGQRLAIAADGALQYVPFSALPAPKAGGAGPREPLLRHHEIVHLPSAAILAALRREAAERSPVDGLLAMIADPVFDSEDPRLSDGDRRAPGRARDTGPYRLSRDLERSARDLGVEGFARLPYSGAEAEAILALAPEGERFAALGLRASRETVMSGELDGYRFVHFATHGIVNARHPTLSGIVLSLVDEHGRPRDGLLRVQELVDLRLAADLVVLSACQTALGKEIRGEGLMGLTYGFFYAGAARVVVSLWRVDDRATAELMTRFYRGMLADGLAPARALRQAQLSMAGDGAWKAPYYWAGFVLQGDWRP